MLSNRFSHLFSPKKTHISRRPASPRAVSLFRFTEVNGTRYSFFQYGQAIAALICVAIMHISDEAKYIIPMGMAHPTMGSVGSWQKTVGDLSVLSVCQFIIQNYPKLLNHAESFWANVELSVVTENHLQLQADHGSKGAGEASAMSENWKLFMGVVMLGGDG